MTVSDPLRTEIAPPLKAELPLKPQAEIVPLALLLSATAPPNAPPELPVNWQESRSYSPLLLPSNAPPHPPALLSRNVAPSAESVPSSSTPPPDTEALFWLIVPPWIVRVALWVLKIPPPWKPAELAVIVQSVRVRVPWL